MTLYDVTVMTLGPGGQTDQEGPGQPEGPYRGCALRDREGHSKAPSEGTRQVPVAAEIALYCSRKLQFEGCFEEHIKTQVSRIFH